MSLGKDILLAIIIILVLGLIAYATSLPRYQGGYYRTFYSEVPAYNTGGIYTGGTFSNSKTTTTNTYTTTTPGVTVTTPPVTSPGRCYVGGCSAQICSDSPNVVSTCEYSPVYACYQGATCERQASGSCGWTMTSSLAQCIADSQNP